MCVCKREGVCPKPTVKQKSNHFYQIIYQTVGITPPSSLSSLEVERILGEFVGFSLENPIPSTIGLVTKFKSMRTYLLHL